MQISLDYTNMMADAIGAEYGVSDDELAALSSRTAEIHAQICQSREQGELPFFDLPEESEMLAEVQVLAAELRQSFENIIVLGIGGSALGTAAVMRALSLTHNLQGSEQRPGAPRLFVLDNVDPDGFSAHLALCHPAKTCFLVVSKSGATVETSCQFLLARQWVETAVGTQNFQDHFVLITDPENGVLRALAQQHGYRSCTIPPGVGGRFSVLTPVGLLPLACAGVDIAALMQGAADFAKKVCHGDLMTNPAYLNATLQYLAYQKGLKISVMMPYSDRLRDIADWFRQLWAESLGKRYGLNGQELFVGPTPINALGTTDQHSQVQLYMEGPVDKVVTFIAVDRFANDLKMSKYDAAPQLDYLSGHSMAELIGVELLATTAALTRNHRPNCTLRVSEVSPESVGALLYLFEVQTLFAGYLFEVNPLDQPGVEEGKQFTYALMGREGFEEKGREYASIQSRSKPRLLDC
ncbi:MAG: glucose-6-phosphate isomerase [Desulfuromonadales bacterium]|nr:glucose-6-phosphate isomerase [Desulfuromonadales bacterium]